MPKISALPELAAAQGDDEFAVVDISEGETKRLPVSAIAPTGMVVDFAGSTAPTGWLLCYGQTIDADANPEYQQLYDAIGNTFGGSDNSDFVIPDLRGRVIAGKDNMGGSSANRLTDQSGGLDGDVLGDAGGAETHTLTTAQMPSHDHDIRYYAPTDTTGGGYISILGQSGSGTGVALGSATARGDGGAHNNVQPTIILNKIIKY